MLVLGVALLAAFLFIGGGAAIYLSAPAQVPDPNIGLIGDLPTPGASLDVFVQDTPTPAATPGPTATPFFFTPDPASFLPTFALPSPTPSFDLTPTPSPTRRRPAERRDQLARRPRARRRRHPKQALLQLPTV